MKIVQSLIVSTTLFALSIYGYAQESTVKQDTLISQAQPTTDAGSDTTPAIRVLSAEGSKLGANTARGDNSKADDSNTLIYSNLSPRQLTIKGASRIIAFTDMGGNAFIREITVTSNQNALTVSIKSIPNGIYLITWLDNKGEVHASKIRVLK